MPTHEDRIVEIKGKYGRTIQDILAKEGQYDRHEILRAIEMLVWSKLHQKLPTSKSERMVFAFAWLVREVLNGGFDQYFCNSAGDYWEDVLYGLGAISDEEGLAAFKKVLSIFPNSMPSLDSSERFDQLHKSEEDIDVETLKDCFAKAKKVDDLTVVELPEGAENDEAEARDEWNAKVEEHWKKLTPEYYRKPYPNSNLVYEYVKRHAADFDLENA